MPKLRDRVLTYILVALLLQGCAVSPAQFRASRSTLSDTRVCNTWHKARRHSNVEFLRTVVEEAEVRGLSSAQCDRLITRQRLAAVGAVLLTATLVAVAANNAGGGGAAPNMYAADYEWDWDIFNNHGQEVVRCRGVQTGRFAQNSRCRGKFVSDRRWPGP